MPDVHFSKYHGAGNDFVVVDDRDRRYAWVEEADTLAHLCQRHTGIGADGLIFLRYREGQPHMVYYNADGAPSSFCGNGSRCFVQALHHVGDLALGDSVTFQAHDGSHTGTLLSPSEVRVSMRVASTTRLLATGDTFVDTGSPHVVHWSEVLPKGNLAAPAHAIRYSPAFAKTGVNVNFCSPNASGGISIRTYERGVEAETLACGTGVTAAAISYAERENLTGGVQLPIQAVGGDLRVEFVRSPEGLLEQVFLVGPSKRVFTGSFSL